jgi:hypothetical protein
LSAKPPAGLSQQRVLLGTALARSGFEAVRPARKPVIGEQIEEGGPMGFMFAGADGEEQGSPVSQGIDRALEAEPIQGEPLAEGGVKHDGADQIVVNRLHPDFRLD